MYIIHDQLIKNLYEQFTDIEFLKLVHTSIIKFFQQYPFQVMVYQNGERHIFVDLINSDTIFEFNISAIKAGTGDCRAVYHLEFIGSIK